MTHNTTYPKKLWVTKNRIRKRMTVIHGKQCIQINRKNLTSSML